MTLLWCPCSDYARRGLLSERRQDQPLLRGQSPRMGDRYRLLAEKQEQPAHQDGPKSALRSGSHHTNRNTKIDQPSQVRMVFSRLGRNFLTSRNINTTAKSGTAKSPMSRNKSVSASPSADSHSSPRACFPNASAPYMTSEHANANQEMRTRHADDLESSFGWCEFGVGSVMAVNGYRASMPRIRGAACLLVRVQTMDSYYRHESSTAASCS